MTNAPPSNLFCNKCGYAMSPMDIDCPRCRIMHIIPDPVALPSCWNCKQPTAHLDAFCKSCGKKQPIPASIQPIQPSQYPSNVAPFGQPALQQTNHTKDQILLDEMARQYVRLTWLQFFGCFLFSAYLIGVVIYIYAMVQKPAFRRKVAEMGYDPDQWSKPLREHETIVTTVGLVLFVLTPLIILWWYFSHLTPGGTP